MEPDNQKVNQTALITGASRRIGKAMAIHLASRGWNLAIHFHKSLKAAEKLQDELQKSYPAQEFLLFQSDLQNPFAVGELVPKVIQTMGQIDLLINNASIFEKADIIETHFDLLDRQMMINYRAPFLLTRDFARLAENGGTIVNMVDTRITSNKSDHAAYSLSKKALWELTKMAAVEFAPEIRVNAIAPGATIPPADKDDNYLWGLAKDTPMQKPSGLTPILQILDFILENNHLTGQLLFADGGENLGTN